MQHSAVCTRRVRILGYWVIYPPLSHLCQLSPSSLLSVPAMEQRSCTFPPDCLIVNRPNFLEVLSCLSWALILRKYNFDILTVILQRERQNLHSFSRSCQPMSVSWQNASSYESYNSPCAPLSFSFPAAAMRRSHVIVVGVVQIIAAPLSEAPRPGKEYTISTFCLITH